MTFNIDQLFQKYVCRAADRLMKQYRIPSISLLGLSLIASLSIVIINGNVREPLLVLGLVIIFFLPFVVGICTWVFAGIYHKDYDQMRDRRLAQELIKILKETGPVSLEALQAHYNRTHAFNLPIKIKQLVTQDQNADIFFYDTVRELVSTVSQAKEIAALPYPVAGDYRTAYYQLHRRLQAIRQHPELATVQDSLIDDVYGIHA